MTPQEALTFIQKQINQAVYVEEYGQNEGIRAIYQNKMVWLPIVKEALEKQIPKKPVIKTHKYIGSDDDFKKNIKAEAIKEFAERLKEKAFDCGISDNSGNGYGGATVILYQDIDNLVKEMVGDDKCW